MNRLMFGIQMQPNLFDDNNHFSVYINKKELNYMRYNKEKKYHEFFFKTNQIGGNLYINK